MNEAVPYTWKVGGVLRFIFIVVHFRGLVVGVFRPYAWLEGTPSIFGAATRTGPVGVSRRGRRTGHLRRLFRDTRAGAVPETGGARPGAVLRTSVITTRDHRRKMNMCLRFGPTSAAQPFRIASIFSAATRRNAGTTCA